MRQNEYKLAPHVHMCNTNGYLVFLNETMDEYIACNRECSQVINDRIIGGKNNTDIDRKTLAELEKLVERRLLTINSQSGRQLALTSVPEATQELLEEGANDLRPNAKDVLEFFIATVKASFFLRYRPFRYTVSHVSKRKQKRKGSIKAIDLEYVREQVKIFNAMRCFYSRDYLCMFDSLALIEFLACRKVFPTWVYGVTAEPFYAHCWVQDLNLVFNDHVEAIRRYTPIMAI